MQHDPGRQRPREGWQRQPAPRRQLPIIGDIQQPVEPEPRLARLRERNVIVPAIVVFVLLVAGVGLLARSDGSGDEAARAERSELTSTTEPVLPRSARMVPPGDLRVGDCLVLDGVAERLGQQFEVPVVACDERHTAEVVGLYAYDRGDLPSVADEEIVAWNTFVCAVDFQANTGQSINDTELRLSPLLGIRRTLVVCVVSRNDGSAVSQRMQTQIPLVAAPSTVPLEADTADS